MNKRIEELAKLAETKEIGYYFFDREKFAELIVKECDRYVAEHYDEYEPYIKPGDLLKHFGVE
jgi:hypothetical protein